MKSAGSRDLVVGVLFLAVGLASAYFTSVLPTRSLPNTPGPEFFPWIVTGALLVLSLALLVRSLLVPAIADEPAKDEGEGKAAPVATAKAAMALVLAGFIIYIAVLPHLGFLIATAPFFALLMVLFGERRAVLVGGSALAATVLLYVIFRHVFQIILPQGILIGLVP